MPWTALDIPDQHGRHVVVTGANSGLGFETVRALARRRATITLACRSEGKANAAMEAVLAETPDAQLSFLPLDLADLSSIATFATSYASTHDHLDLLINNAGIMAIPAKTTADGFEMQLGTNHLGHFALSGHLLPLLEAAPQPRLVQVSSMAHRMGKMTFDDLMRSKRYERWSVYGQSKLANLLFVHELQRRLSAAGKHTIAVAAHPGYAATNLQFVGPQMDGSAFAERISALGNRLFAQSAEMGALPQLYAATESVEPGAFYGPDGFMGAWGHPARTTPTAAATDDGDALTLWTRSVELTHVDFGGI